MAGAALSQGHVFLRLELRGRRSTFARSGAAVVAGTALSQSQVHFCGRRITFEGSSTDFVAGAALSQVQVQMER